MQWRIRVDTGGTFTDAWAVGPDGIERRAKILSDGTLRCRLVSSDGDWWTTDSELAAPDGTFTGWTSDEATVLDSGDGARLLQLAGNTASLVAGSILELTCGDEAPVAVARILTGTPAGEKLPPVDFRVATTRGTNALLERKGAKLAFFTTRGFFDLLVIRDQRRGLLFSLAQPEPEVLPAFTAAVAGRHDAEGREVVPFDEATLREAAKEALAAGCTVAAVAFLHSWREPAHELRAAEILRVAGFPHVTLSSDIAPLIRLLPRAETAVADAFLTPVMEHFVRRISESGSEPWLMTSAGGLVPASRFRPKDSLLSGPAGGLVGAAELARAAGFPKVLTFDMGGTSTDVARIDGPFVWRQEQQIGPARVFAPALSIETVAAGGGSICQWRNGRLEVGPESAGADPGPACYGRGGPLTLTDVNLLLGLMDPDKAGIPLDRAASEERLRELLTSLHDAGESSANHESLLVGLRDIAVETMAEAIRGVSIREGASPEDFALLAFGGAGPQHACAVAEKLGVRSVLIPADAGLLSAWGLERARRQEQRVRQILRHFDEARESLAVTWKSLAADAATTLAEPDFRWLADLRLTGQDNFLTVEADNPACPADELIAAFVAGYQKLYGYPPPANRALELVALRVVAEERAAPSLLETFAESATPGPQLLQDRFSTCVIPEAWQFRQGTRGTLLLEKCRESALPSSIHDLPSSIRNAIFRSRFEGIVTAMGEMLRRTALSTNVKERLDYSCALLDADGQLVASAPHVPVHLGALGVCIREVLRVVDPGPGDVIVTNHPGFGGSHLPDVTLIAAIFDGAGERVGFVANRAHHAEIGGKAPGSMPADARFLAEEGVVIAPRFLVREGDPQFPEIEALLRDAPWPSRRISDNLADLEAQLASIHHGVHALERLATEHGGNVVRGELRGILDRSSALMATRLTGLSFDRTVTSTFDDGTPLQLRLTAGNGRLKLDFTGTGGVHPRNLNATPAIVRSAVVFSLRLWLGEDVPLNEGLLQSVETIIPPGLLAPDFSSDPETAPAVVGGNVETSQRLTDLLLEALDLAANGPGTMNNFLFGDATFGYYETLAGGSGAGPHHHGSSGRHVHMTNTAITDPELLEHRFPVRLWKYEIRRNSAGEGEHRGGDGVIREVEFLKPLVVSFLTERRLTGPRGLHGGSDGQPGSQTRLYPDGREEILPGAITYPAAAGERVVIETPGGGGWGL